MPVAHAATLIPVNTFNDELNVDGKCSLREAIKAANTDATVDACPAGSGADIIGLPGGTYNLTLAGASEDLDATGDLDIRQHLTLTGAITSTTIIDGGGLDRVFDIFTSTVTISNVMIRNGNGMGGINNRNGSNLTLENSTVWNNNGPGILNGNGSLILNNSTISTNTGGGIINSISTGMVTLNNVTITGNTTALAGGGVSNSISGTVTLQNTIIAGNSDSVGSPDCSGTLTSLGYNLIGDSLGCTISATNNIIGQSPNLGPLQDQGGPAFTHALLTGSPAIDAGNPTGCIGSSGPLTSDERGVARPQGPACDMGAYEALQAQFSSNGLSEDEGNGSALVTVTLSAAPPVTATLNYSTTDGTALSVRDYVTTTGTLTFGLGVTTTSFTVPITDDTTFEADETVLLSLGGAADAVITGTNPATLTILDNDAQPTVQFGSSAFGVNEGAGTATIAADLSAVSELTATVNYTTTDGTAAAGSDYVAGSGTLTFAPFITSTTFTVPITDDATFEGDETIWLMLGSAVSATITGTNPATLTILNDDLPPAVQLSSSAYSVNENAGPAVITAELSAASELTATVNYNTTSNGSATAGSDYTAVSNTLTFAPLQTAQTITVPITDDAFYDPNETVMLALNAPSNATLGTPDWAMLTIVDNDPFRVFLPVVLRDNLSYFEGPLEVEPNDNYLAANGPLRFGRTYQGTPDARDYFSIYLPSAGRFKVDLTNHAGQGVQLQLFYESTDDFRGYDPVPPYSLDYTGPAGWYYIYIFTASGYPSATPYDLVVTFPYP